MNTYEISYTETRIEPGKPVRFVRTIVAASVQAKNGIEAIRSTLAVRFAGDADLLSCLCRATSVGSNKRLYVAGIAFEAKKIGE